MLGLFSKDRIFEGSDDLKKIVEKHGWALYDIPLLQRGAYKSRFISKRADPLWRRLNKLDPAENYRMGKTYTFLPKPKARQTLEKACGGRGFLGPSIELSIEDNDPVILYISALAFTKKSLLLTSPPGLFIPSSLRINVPENDSIQVNNQSAVSMEYGQVVKKFEKDFKITKFNELYINMMLSRASREIN